MAETGTLYIVATPIGNLEDVTERAKRILHQVDLIVAEDTRHSAHLLQHLRVQCPLTAYHAHNEQGKTEFLLNELKNGKQLALVSDAGTPLISDPGFPLVRAAQEAHIPIVPLPGPCALITALSVSGLAPLPFYFAGFLPAKSSQRKKALEELVAMEATLIFYEAPHRLLEMVQDAQAVLGDRQACLARELTKQFETVIRTSLSELVKTIEQDSNQERGEMVLLIEGNKVKEKQTDAERILRILLKDLPLKQAASLCAEITGEKKNKLYELGVREYTHR